LRLPTPDFRLPIFHCVSLDPPTDLLQPAMLLVTAQITLSPAELAHFGQLKLPDRKRAEWLFGRIAAKDAVRLLWWTRERERLFPADIEIEPDAHGRPVAVFRDRGRLLEFPNVSISHSAGVSMALAAHVPCVGIDIEKVVPREKGFDEVAFDENERRLLDQFRPRRDEALTRLWCAKEAVAKALGRGLVDGPRSLAVRRIDANCGTAGVALGRRLAAEFPQFDNCLLQVHTFLDDDFVVATTLCERLP
jgi:phosphopantetheinyl transferase